LKHDVNRIHSHPNSLGTNLRLGVSGANIAKAIIGGILPNQICSSLPLNAALQGIDQVEETSPGCGPAKRVDERVQPGLPGHAASSHHNGRELYDHIDDGVFIADRDDIEGQLRWYV